MLTSDMVNARVGDIYLPKNYSGIRRIVFVTQNRENCWWENTFGDRGICTLRHLIVNWALSKGTQENWDSEVARH